MSNPYLEIINGQSGQTIPMEAGKLTIGRQAGNDVVLEDTQSSRNHCLIEHVGGDYVLRDLTSKNGTRVNGQLVTQVVLGPDDVIIMGQTDMKFVVPVDSFEEVDVLSAEDIVEVEGPTRGRGGDEATVPAFKPLDDDYEGAMDRLAEALPDKTFSEYDIELINARGGVMHEGGKVARARGKRDSREAVDIFRQ